MMQKKHLRDTFMGAALPSLLELVEWILPSLPENLIEGESKRRLLECATFFPGEIEVSSLLFECPLSHREQWMDIAFFVKMPSCGFASLEKTLGSERFGGNGHWENLIAFVREWEERGFFRQRKINGIWIELDTGSAAIWPPLPNFFLSSAFRNQEEFLKTNEEVLSRFKKKIPSRKSVSRCITDSFLLIYIGIMPGRSLDGVRLCSSHLLPLSHCEWNPYLRSLDFPHSFISLLEKISPHLERLVVQVDIGKGLLPRGVECYVKGKTPEERNQKWGSLLDLLRSEKREKLLDWMGSQYILHGSGADFYEPFSSRLVKREINHIKLIPEHPIRTKVYLKARAFS